MTARETVEVLTEPLRVFGEVRIKPMFGEWGVYIEEKFAAIAGDGRLFLKVKSVPAETVDALFGGYTEPYPGAKNYAEVSPERFADEAWMDAVRKELVLAKIL